MKDRIVVDTNVLLKVFFKEEGNETIVKFFEAIEQKEIAGFLSAVSLSEIVTIFSRREKIEELENVLEWLIRTFTIISVTPELSILSGYIKSKYSTAKSPLSFADSVIAASSLIYNATLVTYDSEFDKIKEIEIKTAEHIILSRL